MPEKFENGGLTLKMHQMFLVHTTPEKFENASITGNWIRVRVKLEQGNIVIITTSSFSKSLVFFQYFFHPH